MPQEELDHLFITMPTCNVQWSTAKYVQCVHARAVLQQLLCHLLFSMGTSFAKWGAASYVGPVDIGTVPQQQPADFYVAVRS